MVNKIGRVELYARFIRIGGVLETWKFSQMGETLRYFWKMLPLSKEDGVTYRCKKDISCVGSPQI